MNQDTETAVDVIRAEIEKQGQPFHRRAFEKFLLAALGSIPWVGGFISAAATLKLEESTLKLDSLQTQWLEEHEEKIARLKNDIAGIVGRFENFGQDVDERIESAEYLDVVRKAFRAWDEADTEEKRRCIGNLIANAAGTRLVSDDVLRLFIDWLSLYHESHLAVIRHIYQDPGATRYEIWVALYGEVLPREDSAEADMYRLLIRDLSTGGVIRQARETDEQGRFLRRRPTPRRGGPSTVNESSFEETKPYVLTELGKQFVHYTMTEVVERISSREG